MEIRELWLKDYGKFHNHKLQLKEGMNIIYGGNEAGKSTIHSFIRAMLFGLTKKRGKGARTDEYQTRQPWDRPGSFAGSMLIEDEGEQYLIERSFAPSAQSLRIITASTGEPSQIPEQILFDCLGGLSETAFVNSVFLPQSRGETDEALSEELRSFLLNTEHSMDEHIDVTAALQILRKKKKQIEAKQNEAEQEMQKKLEEQQRKADHLNAEIALLQQQIPYKAKAQPQRSRQTEKTKDHSIGRIILELLLFFAGVGAVGGSIYTQIWQLKVFLMIFGVVFLLMMLTVMFLFGPSEKEEEIEESLSPEVSYLQQRLASLRVERDNVQRDIDALYQTSGQEQRYEEEISALQLAIDRICQLSADIYATSGNQVSERASEILCELTNGKYYRINLNQTSEVQIYSGNRTLGLHQVSGGTMQQIYFALRIAAGEILAQDKVLPIILDEAFVYYDDKRLEAVMRWLIKSGRQVILFTSQKREHQMLQNLQSK